MFVLLPEWMLLLVWRCQRAEMQKPSSCWSGDESMLKHKNWPATGLENLAC